MKIPRRAMKCLEHLDALEGYLEYYLAGTDELKRLKVSDIKHIRDYIMEISETKKLHDIKLATKIKKELK